MDNNPNNSHDNPGQKKSLDGMNGGPNGGHHGPMGPQNGAGGLRNFGGPNNPAMRPNGPQGSNMGPQGQRPMQNGPMRPGMGPNMGPNGPQGQQMGPQRPMGGPNGPMGPNMGPNGPRPPMGPNGQSMMGPNGQPMGPNGPMPAPKPPKKPMDPKKKKKIIIGVSAGVGALIVAIVVIVLVIVLSRVDYGPAYLQAKSMDDKIYDIYSNYDCKYAVDYVKSDYPSTDDYAEYVTGCKSVGDGVGAEVDKLEKTAGVERNAEIKAQFGRFKEAFNAAMPDSATLNSKLDLYEAWHKFVVMVDDLSYGDAESEFTAAANVLINSGNDTLKTYGEGWLEKTLDASRAYTKYYAASYSDSNKSSLRTEYNNKKSAQSEWVAANAPDITEIAPLDFSKTSAMYDEWEKLYEMIATTYANNYNKGSGDCAEFLGEVYCD